MAASGTKSVILTIILASLCMQATALPLLIRLLLEPGLIDVRIRAAAVFNKAGLGLGGLLTKSGELIHSILSGIGNEILQTLNNIAKLFQSPGEKVDDDSGLKTMREKLEQREKERKKKEEEGEHDKEKDKDEIREKGRPSKYHEQNTRSVDLFKFTL